MKTCAVIGAGFAGLATTWELLKNYQVHLYDQEGIGGGASSLSAGLLHPYAGPHAKLIKEGQEGMEATESLLAIASQTLERPVFQKSGMLRLAATNDMARDFKSCAEKHEEVIWLTAEECQAKVDRIAFLPGLWIPSALTVDSQSYLTGIWQACERAGAQLMTKKISSLTQLDHYDAIVIATGASAQELATLSLTPIKGQVLELEWPAEWPPLPFPLNSQAYLLMLPGKTSCLAGATFERHFTSPLPDLETAKRELLPKIKAIYPGLEKAKILHCRAGVRASTSGHLPCLQQINAKSWVFTGLGSKGLIYHALYAQRLAKLVEKWMG